MSRRSSILAFTLIELLTVIAITAVLLTIIVVPVVQSFNMTRQAQAFADAQDRARILSQKIAKELENSMGPRDLSGYVNASVNGVTELVPASTLSIVVPSVGLDGSEINNSTPVQVLLPYAKLDIIQPAQGQSLGPGLYVDPRTNFIDPTLQGPKGQVSLPLGIGATMVRYWIGLHDPTAAPLGNPTAVHANPYLDPYTGLLMAQTSARDNLYVLYRAEIQPYVWRAYQGAAVNPTPPPAYRPNLTYFQADTTDTTIIDEDDPSFFSFIPNVDLAADGITLTASGLTKANRIAAWKKVATLQTDISRYDLIFPVYDKASRKIKNIGGVPELISLAQFRPTRIAAETVAGETASRLGEESASGAAVSPDVFVTQYGLWSNPVVRTFPIGWAPGSTTGQSQYYEVGRRDLTLLQNPAYPNLNAIFMISNPTSAQPDDTVPGTGFPLFSLDTYDYAKSSGLLYPFSQAVITTYWSPSVAQVFIPYSLNRKTGKIITSFGIQEVGNPSVTPSTTNPYNLPTVPTTDGGTGPIYTPSTDPTVGQQGVGEFSDPIYNSINERYNKLWTDYPQFRPNIHRFIDLRVTPNADGTLSPLYPDYIAGQVTGLGRIPDPRDPSGKTTLYSRVSIVPGTDEVIGPDQLPGVGYGGAIRYTRVTSNPGPDQYCINYTDLPQPTQADGITVDYAVAFPGFLNPQPTYTATDFVTAILQPRYKVGYVQFCSDPNVPLPTGNISVSYRFQVSGKLTGALASQLSTLLATPNLSTTDSFSVDYDSRQLMDVLLTVRNYPQASLNPNPQTVTLKSTAAVRNYQR